MAPLHGDGRTAREMDEPVKRLRETEGGCRGERACQGEGGCRGEGGFREETEGNACSTKIDSVGKLMYTI